ncbi:hypothetical protein M2368_003561 [Arthrobacter sp. JUb119]|uniref:hypothetical protein n=1 Tax=Arthrobacter sp. JUb115 TaxID=2485108 RepID=UPI0010604F78|nr:hypothetical protein [Arthrobacter sp. JUb115]MCS3494529.1 hypothetical protein [Arthrobacter sp. JUb119]
MNLSMDVPELTERIAKKHGEKIEALFRKVTGPQGHTGPATVDAPSRRIPGLGPVKSLWDPLVDLTLGSDISDLSWLTEGKVAEGTCLTLSIAGHHRVTGSRVPLPSGECDAWLWAIYPQWASEAYRAGTLSGVDQRLTTVYYRVFFDAAGEPMQKPEHFTHPGLRPLNEL